MIFLLYPGKILDIMVHEGDSITAGQPVVLLEVMKMENELLAPAGGVVEKIHVEKNNSVGAGDVLLTIR